MDKLKYIKVEQEDGTLSENIPIGVDAKNVDVSIAGGSENLANYLTNNDANIRSLNSKDSTIETKVNQNTSAIRGLASGSPKGSYATVAALQSANPDTGVYIVTADGHIYSWTKNQSGAPIDLGVYQSTGIADNSVTPDKLSNELQNIINYKYKDIDYTLSPDGFLKVTNVRGTPGGVGTEAIPVSAGDKFKISGRVGGTIYLYILLNSSNNVVSFFPTSGVPYGTTYTDELLTIPEGVSSIVVNSTGASYIKIEKQMIGINNDYLDTTFIDNKIEEEVESKITETDLNKLYQKTAIFAGDSICHGTSVGVDDPTYGYGWAGRIGIKNNMTWKNYGLSGAVMASGITGKHSILGDVPTMFAEYPNADYIIFEGGVNDVFAEGETLGEITSDYTDNFQINTYCGALEKLFYTALTNWTGKKIGFIIPHKMGSVSGISQMNVYHEKARDICKKWSIPFIDLFNISTLNSNIPAVKSALFAPNDTWHLSSAGYEVITPKIEAWLKTL